MDALISFYVTALPITIAMFVKREGKNTLTETFDEAIKIEKEMMSLKENPGA